jgi:hypothetical protein
VNIIGVPRAPDQFLIRRRQLGHGQFPGTISGLGKRDSVNVNAILQA